MMEKQTTADGDSAGRVRSVPLRDAKRSELDGAAAADDRLLEGRAAAGQEEHIAVSSMLCRGYYSPSTCKRCTFLVYSLVL